VEVDAATRDTCALVDRFQLEVDGVPSSKQGMWKLVSHILETDPHVFALQESLHGLAGWRVLSAWVRRIEESDVQHHVGSVKLAVNFRARDIPVESAVDIELITAVREVLLFHWNIRKSEHAISGSWVLSAKQRTNLPRRERHLGRR